MNQILVPDDGRAEGRMRKQHAHGRLSSSRSGAAFVRHAQRTLLHALLKNGEATVDAIRETIALPDDVNPVSFGAVPGPLARAGIIERDGYLQTSRPAAHARPITVWRLRDRNGAERWLATHPDIPLHP